MYLYICYSQAALTQDKNALVLDLHHGSTDVATFSGKRQSVAKILTIVLYLIFCFTFLYIKKNKMGCLNWYLCFFQTHWIQTLCLHI